jgi:hypothetical protein
MATEWNMFVKKIFHEGRNKDKSYSFKNALQDASKRKGEMGKTISRKTKTKKSRKSKSSKRSKSRKH